MVHCEEAVLWVGPGSADAGSGCGTDPHRGLHHQEGSGKGIPLLVLSSSILFHAIKNMKEYLGIVCL